jgi:hypothetical protein
MHAPEWELCECVAKAHSVMSPGVGGMGKAHTGVPLGTTCQAICGQCCRTVMMDVTMNEGYMTNDHIIHIMMCC